MAKSGGKNHTSIWFWMAAIFVIALPCIGTIMVFVWAFTGGNESRKNFFKAVLAWHLIMVLLWAGLLAFGFWPVIQQHLQQWMHQIQNGSH